MFLRITVVFFLGLCTLWSQSVSKADSAIMNYAQQKSLYYVDRVYNPLSLTVQPETVLMVSLDDSLVALVRRSDNSARGLWYLMSASMLNSLPDTISQDRLRLELQVDKEKDIWMIQSLSLVVSPPVVVWAIVDETYGYVFEKSESAFFQYFAHLLGIRP